MTLVDVVSGTAPQAARRRLQFVVKGLPAPQGSKSFKGFSKKGHAILKESSDKVAPWRTDVVIAAETAIEQTPGFKPFSGPVHLIIEFYMPRPKGAPKTRRVVPDVMPDLSKLVRSTEDALKTAAVWRDDSQVVDLTTRKRYATFGDEQIGHAWELPGIGAVVTVIELDHEDTWADAPLDAHAATRLPLPTLPSALTRLPTPALARSDEWGSDVLVIPASATESKARQMLAKVLKDSDRRIEQYRTDGTMTSGAFAVIIEGGAHRLASPIGKPLTGLQSDVIQLAEEAETDLTEIVIILAAAVE